GEAQQSRERLEFLAEASRILSTSLDYGRTLQQVARLIVPRLADWCSVDIKEDDGAIRQVALAHVDPEKIKWGRELTEKYPPDQNAPTGAPNVIRTGRSEIYPEIPEEMLDEAVGDDDDLRRIIEEIGFSSLMIVPLAARGRRPLAGGRPRGRGRGRLLRPLRDRHGRVGDRHGRRVRQGAGGGSRHRPGPVHDPGRRDARAFAGRHPHGAERRDPPAA